MKASVKKALAAGASVLCLGFAGVMSASSMVTASAVEPCDPEDFDCTEPSGPPDYVPPGTGFDEFGSSSIWGDLRIRNVDGQQNIAVCKDWQLKYATQEVSQTVACGTPSSSNSGFLAINATTSTQFGWADTDGVRVDAGWKIREEIPGPNRTISDACSRGTFWQKTQPSVPVPGTYMTRKYYRIPC